MTRLRTVLPAVAFGFAAVLGIVGCSAGQETQTQSMEPAVNGNRGQVGSLALRDVLIAYPESGTYVEGENAPLILTIVNTGPDADRLVQVTSPVVDEGDVQLLGNPSLPGRTALQVVVPEPGDMPSSPVEEPSSSEAPSSAPSSESSSAPSSPPASESSTPPSEGAEDEEPADSVAPTTPEPTGSQEPEVVGTMSIVLMGLNMDLPFGRNFPVTFVFENAGQITIDLPIGAPATPREPAPEAEDEGEGGH